MGTRKTPLIKVTLGLIAVYFMLLLIDRPELSVVEVLKEIVRVWNESRPNTSHIRW